MTAMGPDAEQVRAQLDRILSSTTFAEAERARKFLRFVVETVLAGRSTEIKESVIGTEVLGRPPSFDPRSDPIVRVEAGRLRTRLLTYYHSEGATDPFVIELPKGGYVPLFAKRPSAREYPSARSKSAKFGVLLMAASVFGFLVAWAIWSYRDRDVLVLRSTVRLSVLPPEGSEFKNAALSPDGRYLAFAATTGKVTRLWVRALDSVEAHALPGTEQAAYPFWSPDSRSIGFFSAGKLKRIDVSGGPARDVCAVQPAFGGTWSALGVILFAQRPNGAIFQVAADGGAPKPVTTLDRPRGDIAHLFPYFLPDGRHFLYSVITEGPREAAVRAGSIDSREFKSLLSADLGAAYRPPYAGHPGSLLFAYHGALMSQPFDVRRLELTGAASELAPQIRHVGSRAEFSVSSSGLLSYQADTERDRQLTWFDRTGRALGRVGAPNNYNSVILSPDDKQVAIEAEDPASGRLEIWTMDLDSGRVFRISPQTAEGLSPIWSPEGNEIVFSSATNSGMTLVRQALDNLNPRPLLEAPGVKVASDWSSDRKWLAYTSSWPRYENLGIWVTPVSGSTTDRGRSFSSAGHNECCAVFSPALPAQGPRWFAYSSDETGQSEVYVKDFPGGEHRWEISTEGGWLPHWSRDGRELFYLAPDGKLMKVDIAGSRSSAFGGPRVLFDTLSSAFSYPTLPSNTYSVSKDRKRFLVNYAARRSVPQSITILLPSR